MAMQAVAAEFNLIERTFKSRRVIPAMLRVRTFNLPTEMAFARHPLVGVRFGYFVPRPYQCYSGRTAPEQNVRLKSLGVVPVARLKARVKLACDAKQQERATS